MAYSPDIVIFKRKHADYYFDVSTPEKRAAAFLTMLRTNHDERWYYEPSEPRIDAERQALALMTDEQINALPETIAADMRTKREQSARSIERAEASYRNEKRWWDTLQELLALPVAEAIKRENGRGVSIAERLASQHSDAEYEGYEFETFEQADLV